MKRIIVFILLGIHLFTSGGYILVFAYFMHQSDVQIVKEIYDNKVDKKLIELKIPIHLPNIQSWDHYEHVEGQIVLKDTFYNYVRMRITRDTLDLLCLPNNVKTRLQKANVILAKEFSDVPLGKKGHELPIKKGLDLQYHFSFVSYSLNYPPFFNRKQSNYLKFSLLNPCLETRGQPPDARC